MIRQIKINHQTVNINYRNESDLSVIEEIFIDRMYRSTESLIFSLQSSTILDIGAHIGLFSIYAAILNPQIKIIALEPEPDNFNLMKENLKLNHIKNIVVKNMALVNNDQKDIILQLSKNTHNHIVPLSNCHIVDSANKEISVPAVNLEKIIIKNKLDKIGLLKMDIEGGEFDIFQNLNQNTWSKIQNIAMEYHELGNNKRADLENIIRSHGFSVEHFPNHFDKRFGLLVCRNRSSLRYAR